MRLRTGKDPRPGFQLIRVTVSVGLVGCRRESTFEIEVDASDEEIEAAATEELWNIVEFSWSREGK